MTTLSPTRAVSGEEYERVAREEAEHLANLFLDCGVQGALEEALSCIDARYSQFPDAAQAERKRLAYKIGKEAFDRAVATRRKYFSPHFEHVYPLPEGV